MSQQTTTYLESKIDATIAYQDKEIEIAFHRAKLKLDNELEINLLKSINSEFKKEFTLTDDQLTIHIFPPDSYERFHRIHEKSNQAKWQFAYNLIQCIKKHAFHRLNLIICPENIMIDQGLMPHFLHYGVSESLPPYEADDERLWMETKAIISAFADNKYDFEKYLSHHETIDLSYITKEIMKSTSYDQLLEQIEGNLKKNNEYEKTVIHVPTKKWRAQRYSILALILFLIPALTYSMYALFFKIPETEAYVESNRSFLQNEYSDVVTKLNHYDDENMPYIVQYQLASSYIANESLTEEQKGNVQNTVTLQSDHRYFLYWIDIGRGNYQEAIDTARLLEDRDLIVYGLLKQREGIKADQSLSGTEREEKLDNIEREIDEYEEEMEQEAVETEQESNES
ncbi:type VII secretion protein EssB [Oceanobacillus longus]|uniref:Type VII secretion protein EssB n=1 Tax=Oceanobacillus longus TaxID=930120 RepID=A0ABV8H0A7_9BACI